MVFDNLNQTASLLQGLGIDNLLLDGEADAFLERSAEALRQLPAMQPGQARPGRIWSEPAQGSAQPRQAAQPKAQAARASLPLQDWPPDWRELFSGARKGRIAWTWWELGLDLTSAKNGHANVEDKARSQARGRLMRQLFADLNMPQGSHTFWPLALPDAAGRPLPNEDCFWSGLDLLGCRGLIIMGSRAAGALLEARDIRPMVALKKNGKFIWVLRDPALIAENPAWQRQALLFLRQSLRPFAAC